MHGGATLWVPGIPVPQGSKVPGVRNNGSPFLRDDNPNLKDWRKTMHEAFAESWEYHDTISDATRVFCRFWLPRPKNRPKTIDVLPLVKPDTDKLIRAVLDSLTTSGVLMDDKLAYDVHGIKRYAIDPVLLPAIYVPGMHQTEPGVQVTLGWHD